MAESQQYALYAAVYEELQNVFNTNEETRIGKEDLARILARKLYKKHNVRVVAKPSERELISITIKAGATRPDVIAAFEKALKGEDDATALPDIHGNVRSAMTAALNFLQEYKNYSDCCTNTDLDDLPDHDSIITALEAVLKV